MKALSLSSALIFSLACTTAMAQDREGYRNASGYTLTLSQMRYDRMGSLTSADAWLVKNNIIYLKGPVSFDQNLQGSALFNYTCRYSFRPSADSNGYDSGWIISFRDSDRTGKGCAGIPADVAGTYAIENHSVTQKKASRISAQSYGSSPSAPAAITPGSIAFPSQGIIQNPFYDPAFHGSGSFQGSRRVTDAPMNFRSPFLRSSASENLRQSFARHNIRENWPSSQQLNVFNTINIFSFFYKNTKDWPSWRSFLGGFTTALYSCPDVNKGGTVDEKNARQAIYRKQYDDDVSRSPNDTVLYAMVTINSKSPNIINGSGLGGFPLIPQFQPRSTGLMSSQDRRTVDQINSFSGFYTTVRSMDIPCYTPAVAKNSRGQTVNIVNRISSMIGSNRSYLPGEEEELPFSDYWFPFERPFTLKILWQKNQLDDFFKREPEGVLYLRIAIKPTQEKDTAKFFRANPAGSHPALYEYYRALGRSMRTTDVKEHAVMPVNISNVKLYDESGREVPSSFSIGAPYP